MHMLQRLRTPLHLAALQGDAASVTGLCMYKAKVNIKDEHALTPLHKAAAQGHDEAAEELLAHNANPNATDEVCCVMLLCISALSNLLGHNWQGCCHTIGSSDGFHAAAGPACSFVVTAASVTFRIWQSAAENVPQLCSPIDEALSQGQCHIVSNGPEP